MGSVGWNTLLGCMGILGQIKLFKLQMYHFKFPIKHKCFLEVFNPEMTRNFKIGKLGFGPLQYYNTLFTHGSPSS